MMAASRGSSAPGDLQVSLLLDGRLINSMIPCKLRNLVVAINVVSQCGC